MSQFTAQKQQVIDACLTLSQAGFLAGTGGNLALRLNDELFAVTPSGADYFALNADDICVLRLRNLEQLEGNLTPSVESGMHACMLLFKTAMQASVHTHQPIASAIALLNMDLPVNDVEDQRALGERIAIVPYAPSGTGFLVRNFKKCLRQHIHAYLLKNHGVICAANTLEQAMSNVARIESAAADFLRLHIESSSHLAPAIRSLTLGALIPVHKE
jgi:L-fuculose-phosphate aldolase